jgi:hypothetical protein
VYDYSAEELLVYDDNNYPLFSGHPRMQGLVYVDKHVQVQKVTAATLFCSKCNKLCTRLQEANARSA